MFPLHRGREDPSLWSTTGQLFLVICARETQTRGAFCCKAISHPTHQKWGMPSHGWAGAWELGRSVTGSGSLRSTWVHLGQGLASYLPFLIRSPCWEAPRTESPLCAHASHYEGLCLGLAVSPPLLKPGWLF